MAQEPYCHKFPEQRNFGTASNLAYRCSDGEWIRCTIFEYERYGDKFFQAVGAVKEAAAIGVVDIINIFQPNEIVIGGAVSAQGDVIIKPVIEYAKSHAFCADTIGIPEISASTIGGDAGIIGAAFLGK